MIKVSKIINRNILIIDHCLRLSNKPHHLVPALLTSFAALIQFVDEKTVKMLRRYNGGHVDEDNDSEE
jgi:hypothetical protein